MTPPATEKGIEPLVEAAMAGNAWPQHTLKADEAAYEARKILAASIRTPEAVDVLVEAQWQPIETAPRDGTVFIAYSQDLTANDLPSFVSLCGWHPDAGFCTDELREPTHWMPLPEPPAALAQVKR